MESVGRKCFEIVLNYGFRITLVLHFTSFNAFDYYERACFDLSATNDCCWKWRRRGNFSNTFLLFFSLHHLVFNSFCFLFSIASCCVFSCNWRFNLPITKFDSQQRTQTNTLFHIAHFPHESKRVHAYLKPLLFKFRFVFVSPRHFSSSSLFPHLSILFSFCKVFGLCIRCNFWSYIK